MFVSGYGPNQPMRLVPIELRTRPETSSLVILRQARQAFLETEEFPCERIWAKDPLGPLYWNQMFLYY